MAQNSQKILENKTEDKCCSENCIARLSDEMKSKFLRGFKLCKNYEAQCAYIVGNVQERQVLNGKKRKCTRTYHISTQEVCLKGFTSVLGVSRNKVLLAMDKLRTGSFADQRGGAHNFLPEETRSAIVEQINSFPHYVSHYRRETSQSLYLDPELNTSTMYRLFKQNWTNNHPDIEAPSIKSYVKIFNSMGLKFKNLKSDTCKQCDKLQIQLKVAKPAEKEAIDNIRTVHWDKAKALREQMKYDFETGRQNPKVQGICYDLQKTFNLPKATSNVFYYTRNLNMFNLGVHDGRTDRGFFHVWLENEAGRGAQEIASCLIKFLDENLQPEAEELIMWSDSCGGQNRNRLMCLMMHYWLSKQKNLHRICLRFLLSGHSYNVCDSDFASVENVVKNKQEIFLPSEVVHIMEKCRLEKPFKVTQMGPHDFFSAQTLVKNITHREKDKEANVKVSWLGTHEIILHRQRPFQLFMSYDVTKDEVSMITKFMRLEITPTQ